MEGKELGLYGWVSTKMAKEKKTPHSMANH